MDVIGQSQFYFDWTELGNISPGVLYYGVATVLEGNDNVVRNIMGSVDYRGCLAKYKEIRGDTLNMVDIQCIPEVKSSGKVIYAPYMGNIRLQMDEQYEQDDEVGGNDETGGNNETGENPSAESESDTGGAGNINDAGDGQEDNSIESVAIDVKKESNNDVITLLSAERDVARDSVMATFGFVAQDGIATEDSDDNEGDAPRITVKAGDTEDTDGKEVTEIPNLGGGESEQKAGGLIWWIVVPLVVAGIGVGAWWFLPIFKRKKKQETVEN